jgi:hypothetical protein
MINECGVAGGAKIGMENRRFQWKSIQMLLYPPQIPHSLIWYRTLTVAVGLFIIYHDGIWDVDLHAMPVFVNIVHVVHFPFGVVVYD